MNDWLKRIIEVFTADTNMQDSHAVKGERSKSFYQVHDDYDAIYTA